MTVELTDFTPFLEGENVKEADVESNESLEEKYRKELIKLRAELEKEIEKVKKEFYSLGFKEGYQRASEEYKKVLLEKEKELSSKYARKLEQISLNVDSIVQEVEERMGKKLNNFLFMLIDSLSEMLNLLYVSPSNLEFLKKEIYQLVNEFPGEELLAVEVGKGLKEVVKGEKVRLNEELDDYDFRLVFKDFKIESSFKEKLNLIREELEREVKETT